MMVISTANPNQNSGGLTVAEQNIVDGSQTNSTQPLESLSAPVSIDEARAVIRDNVAVEDSSVGALIERLAEHDGQFSSFPVSDIAAVAVEPRQLRIGDDNLILTEDGWDRLAKECGASSTYWAQFEPDFRSEIAQYHVDHGQFGMPISPKEGVEAIAVQNRFIGFRQSHLVHLNFVAVVQAVIAGLGRDGRFFTVNRLQMTDESVFVELKTSRRTHAVQVGDVVEGGIAFSHSFLGTTPTTVDLYVFRCVCRNGMALRHCIGHAAISRSRRLKRKDDNSVVDAVSQVTRMTQERMSHLDELFKSLGELPESRIEPGVGVDDEESMRRFLMPTLRGTHLWSNDLWLRVLAPAWRHAHGGNGELHEFAAVNTVTYVATHQQDLSFRQRRTLARLAGMLAFRRIHVCPRCQNGFVGS